VWNDTVTTYEGLLARQRAWGPELDRRGVGPGSVVLIEGSFSPGAVSLLLALVARSVVVVPLTVQSRVHKEKFVDVAEAGATFAFDDADAWTFTVHARSVTNPLTQKLLERGHPGLVIFSSGSSGKQKGVLHDFVALLEKFRRPGIPKSTLTFLLFDHIGGMDSLFNSLSSGGSMVTTPSRDPDGVCRTIAKHKVHTLPTSPTFLNLLLIAEAYKTHDLSSLRVIAYGTESMPATLLKRLEEVLPDVKLVQTFGMSEVGVLRARQREKGSLFIKFTGDGFETKIVDGILWVRTPAAMMGYLNAPDLFDSEGWLNTEDAVEVEGEYLRILGRVTDLINFGGRKVYPAEIENVLLEMDNVRDVAVYGEPNPLVGQMVAARINLKEPEPLDAFKRRLRAFCKDRLPSYKVPARIELTDKEQFGARMKKMRRPS
jgi:acyl-CoA synthetase (AMP-forming)/AMP-acid ligase II